MARVKHNLYRCVGGPFDRKEIALSTEGTLTFRIGIYKGHYYKRNTDDKYVTWERDE